MHTLKEIQLNKQFIVNFDGGKLSSDGGLLMIKEFLHTYTWHRNAFEKQF